MSTTLSTSTAARTLPIVPCVPPTLRKVWRADGILQIGTDPHRAVTFEGISAPIAQFINSVDGSRPLDRYLDGTLLDSSLAREILERLLDAHCLIDVANSDGLPPPAGCPLPFGALTPEVSGRVLGAGERSTRQLLERRDRAQVLITGATRLSGMLCGMFAAAGVGRVYATHSGTVHLRDVVPGGPSLEDVGRSRAGAALDVVRRLSATAQTAALDPSAMPDLVVLTEPWPSPDDRERHLRRLGTPYLCAAIRERRAVVGPFVIPGESSCLRCQDLHRSAIDPGWRAVAAQLRGRAVADEDSAEVAVLALAAGLTVATALQWIDGERYPETINTTLEIAAPDLVLERRYWPRHPICECCRQY